MAIGFFDAPKKKTGKKSNSPVRGCFSCKLYHKANTPKMEPFGNFKKGILNIGEAPGPTDDEKGRPWQGERGKALKRKYKELGIDLFEDCLNINAVSCPAVTTKGKNRQPSSNEIACCRTRVLEIISEYKPRVIVLLGTSAVESVIGARWKKDLGTILKWRGWVIPDRDLQAWVCPTYHPADIEKQTKLGEKEKDWDADLRLAFRQINRPFPSFPDEQSQVKVLEDHEDILRELALFNQGEFYPDNQKYLSIDLETTGLKPHKEGHQIACISLCENENRVVVFPFPKRRSVRTALKQVLENPNIKKIAANMKFEDTWLNVLAGISVKEWHWDTMQAAHILDNRRGITGLKFQTYVNFGVADYDSEIAPFLESGKKDANSQNKVMSLMKVPQSAKKLMTYCGMDALFTFKLAKKQIRTLKARKKGALGAGQWDAYWLTHRGVLAFARMERQGICTDITYCNRRAAQITRQIAAKEKELKESKLYKIWVKKHGANTNMNSTPQLAGVLYEDMKITAKKTTKKGNNSADEEALLLLQGKVPGLDCILQIRKLRKIRDTYLDAFTREQVNGVIHPFFNLHTVVTYRSSSSDPNFQNIPKRDKEAMAICRRAIIPRKGHQLLEIDFSGLEVSIAACYHKDPTMLKYLNDPTSDMHGDMAKEIFIMPTFDKKKYSEHKRLRDATKNGFVFPQFYGDYYANNAVTLCEWCQLPHTRWKPGMGTSLPGGETISEHLISKGIKSFKDFEKHLEEVEDSFWNKRFPVYKKWKERWVAKYLKQGYLDMYTGYRCSGIARKNEIINYPIQGAAFHCLLWSFIQLDKIQEEEKWDSKQINQIHDADIFDTHPDELLHVGKTIHRVTTVDLPKAFPWIIVPLEIEADLCDIDASWSKKQPYTLPEVK